jgi:hypothetical protein
MLSKEQYLTKHKAKFDKSNLSKAERSKRYKDYQLSQTMRKGNNQKKVAKGSRAKPGALSYSTMSECAKLYVKALVDPWNVPGGACVPDAVTIPSYKVPFFVRGRFEVGTLGVGYVVMNPYVCFNGAPMCMGTTSLYNLSVIGNNPSSPGTMLTQYYNNSPYSNDLFAVSATGRRRVVGAGIKARYIGAELTRSGRIIEYRHPINDSVFTGGAVAVQTLLANRETEPGPVDREFHYVVWKPSVPTDLAYLEYSPDIEAPSGSCLLLAVEGAPPGAAFEFDAMAHFEIVGNFNPTTTASTSDFLGYSAIQGALGENAHQPDLPPEENMLSVARGIAKTAATTISFLGPMMGLPPGVTDVAAVANYLL